ncbi:MAG: hypothetical protein I4O49_06485 [Janthinobacterium lividum]|nr:hypothetical protein [Janthinobacterium lividum]
MLLEAVLTLFSQEITGRQRVFPFFLLWMYKKQYQVNNRIAGVEDKKNNSCCINGNSFFFKLINISYHSLCLPIAAVLPTRQCQGWLQTCQPLRPPPPSRLPRAGLR